MTFRYIINSLVKNENKYCRKLWILSSRRFSKSLVEYSHRRMLRISTTGTLRKSNSNIIEPSSYVRYLTCDTSPGRLTGCETAHYTKKGLLSTQGCLNSAPYRHMVTESIGAKIRGIQKDISPLSTKRIVRRKRPKDSVAREQAIFSVTAYATAEEINLETLKVDLEIQGLYVISKLPKDAKDALHVTAKYKIEDEMREIFFFREGSVVFWNVTDVERQNVLHFLRRHQEDAYDARLIEQEFETAEYSYTDTKTTVTGDEFQLKKSEHEMDLQLEKYAFSNALGSSVKLSIWEASLAKYVDSIEGVLQDLKDGNKVKISRSEVLKKMGEMYTLRHLVNLSSDLLDAPDFYWDRAPLEDLYIMTARHHSIPRRVKVINEKLNLCCEMMELLMTQLNDKHHTRLEWMIILLILVEVLFEVGKLITGHH